MTKVQTGGVENATLFIATLPIYLLLFVFELAILCHFVIKSYKLKITKLFKQYAIILIIIILITLIFELWSILVDFSSTFPRRTGYCFIEMYVRILSFILLEAIMFLFWIVRINQIFRFSTFALPQKFVYSIYIIIPTLVLASMILLAVNMDTKYYLVNKSFNSRIEYGHGCIIEVYRAGGSKTVKAVLIIGMITAFSLNIFYGLLFYRKLHQFQYICATAIKASARDTNGKPNAIDILMQKHTLLALISAICSIIVYIIFNILIFTASTPTQNIYAFQLGFLFIDCDMFIKSITMLLMFNLYTRKFYQLCLCCIKISAINYTKLIYCKCCVCCSEIDPTNFNNEIPLFLKMNKKATIIRLNVEEIDDDKYHFDKKTYSSRDLDAAIGTEFYIVKKIPFKYYCLLIKVTINSENNTQKIYNYSINGEKIKNEESIFTQIKRHKARKQSLTRHKNEQAKYGYFTDSDQENINVGVSNHNFYFRKSEEECKYPFIIALKCNAYNTIENGDIIARYVQERIQDNIDNIKKIEKFKYELLLEEIANEIKTKKMDKNILFKRLYESKTIKTQSSNNKIELNMVKTIKNSSKTITTNDKKDSYISVAPASPIIEEENVNFDDANKSKKKKIKERKNTSEKNNKNDDENDNGNSI